MRPLIAHLKNPPFKITKHNRRPRLLNCNVINCYRSRRFSGGVVASKMIVANVPVIERRKSHGDRFEGLRTRVPVTVPTVSAPFIPVQQSVWIVLFFLPGRRYDDNYDQVVAVFGRQWRWRRRRRYRWRRKFWSSHVSPSTTNSSSFRHECVEFG